ncbi:MAG TPA: hypothetical protein DDX39_02085 [Bacteroidales bacterium]|nr:MAG: hypothetical protein A2W98_08705 [Bacteroidetes bacterium GWF2_33_38]OFY75877.1 MAG: hypothetical protein A2265_00165 [Bacteroidetes bacterium RIFOXYA12_FULL_33_9]OFY88350.1 MAG: hypothetical protein A2236_02200 [Bacteroidetes bacterium RIFOXYA2_FULL_33_7]HBF87403.1 hypothetical protein [Bacteroidales bacterium]
MKKLGIIFLALVLTMGLNTTFAQKKGETVYNTPSLPVDDVSKKINYTMVVTTPGSPIDLYKKALRWINTYYKNPTDVIKDTSITELKILGKARFKYMNPADKNGLETMGGILQYTLIIEAKDGRFKYEFTDFNIKASSYTPAELWMDKKSQSYTNTYDYYLIQLDEYAKETVKNLKDFMTTQTAPKAEQW